jgi:hypothetical protein
MPVTSPEEALMARVKTAFDAEFATEWPNGLQYDRLSDSLGEDGAYAAIFPSMGQQLDTDTLVQETQLVVQAFQPWTKQIQPKMQIDPRPIANLAERFRRAARANSSYVGDAHDWYWLVTAIEYPPDPTGNITRFVALVVGYSANAAETTVSG